MPRLQRRLTNLEAVSAPDPPYPAIICVDENGIIYDDGTELTRSWVGRQHRDFESVLPARSFLQVLVGVKPPLLLGD